MKNKAILLLLVLIISLVSTGCGNATDKAIENAINKELGTGVNVDLSDGSLNAKDKGGNEAQVGGDIKWPETVPAEVPVYEGKITLASNDLNSITITIEKYDEKSFLDYIDLLVKKGFTKESEEKGDESSYVATFVKDKIQIAIAGSTITGVAIIITF